MSVLAPTGPYGEGGFVGSRAQGRVEGAESGVAGEGGGEVAGGGVGAALEGEGHVAQLGVHAAPGPSQESHERDAEPHHPARVQSTTRPHIAMSRWVAKRRSSGGASPTYR